MNWRLVIGRAVATELALPADFLHWLLPRLQDLRTRHLDPYGDTSMSGELLGVWIAELRSVDAALYAEARVAAERGGRWPRDARARERLLDEAAERALARVPEHALLRDAIALLELAEQKSGHVDAIGD